MKKLLLISLLTLFLVTLVEACTTFVLHDSVDLVYGRNYDFDLGSGIIVINRSGIEKQAFVASPNDPAKWTSKYGSITFNQIGIDAPMGGMNEKGLTIAQMALWESKYPEINNKKIVNQLEWIQYQLDNSALLSDVIENNSKIQIVPTSIPVHYMVCDRLGSIGVFEFINGELIIHQGDEVTIPVCSNITYADSKKFLGDYDGFGGKKVIPEIWDNASDRVVIANSMLNSYLNVSDKNPLDYGFKILEAVGSKTRTQWSIVFDLKNRTINFKTLNNKNVQTIKVNDLISARSNSENNIAILDIQTYNADTPINEQFRNLTRNDYFKYKSDLLTWYKVNIKGFPDLPDEIINLEVEYLFNRKYK